MEQWVFGGLCRETRACFMVAVEDRTATTLLEVIREKIAPGSNIISDCWRAYNMVYMELYKNHDIVGSRLVPMVASLARLSITPTISLTQTPKRTRKTLKGVGEKQNGATKNSGTHRHMLDSYLCEFLWRQDCKRRDVDEFDEILRNITEFSPLV